MIIADVSTPTETFVVSAEAGKDMRLTDEPQWGQISCMSSIFGCWMTGKVITGCLNYDYRLLAMDPFYSLLRLA